MLPALTTDLNLQVITITVSNLEKSRYFYEEVLGFELKRFYEPTRWVAYHCQGGMFFAIMETDRFVQQPGGGEVVFYIEDIETLWTQIQRRVTVIEPLQVALWQINQFVICDPDGYQLTFIRPPHR